MDVADVLLVLLVAVGWGLLGVVLLLALIG
jgi:hypothetical protein